MVRLDLQFFLCCCRACLGKPSTDGESFYDLLGISKDASVDEIKRAYKRKSLDLHPDKLAQKGKVVTEEDQAKFTRMKEAYEVLSDKHKRETYDAIGEKGMKWIEEPMSVDPQEVANNFANSSTLDRSKIFAIFLGIAIAVFILPILICLQVDGKFGAYASWGAVATPLWIWNAFLLFYHVRVIMMGPIERPEHIPEAEWMDPLPMSKRYMALSRFLLFFVFQVLAVLNLDGVIAMKWSIIFIPVLIVEVLTFHRRWAQSGKEVITVQELEVMAEKPYSEITDEEKQAFLKSYIIFPSKSCDAYLMAKAIQENAKTDLIKIGFRMLFYVFLLLQLDTGANWSWWLVFTPFFAMSCCICSNQCQKYSEVQANAAEVFDELNTEGEGGIDYGAMEEGQNTTENQGRQPLTTEEKEEINAQVLRESYKACSTCCSQAFFLVLVCLCLGKMQGATFSSLWIISPFLFMVSQSQFYTCIFTFFIMHVSLQNLTFLFLHAILFRQVSSFVCLAALFFAFPQWMEMKWMPHIKI